MTGPHAGTVMECGVCWTRYDPAEGDQVAQIPAGTPFSALPDDWRCPTCDGEKHRFLALGDSPATDAESSPADSLAAAYRHIADDPDGGPAGLQPPPRRGSRRLPAVRRRLARHRRHSLVHERRAGSCPTRRLERYPRRHQGHPRPAVRQLRVRRRPYRGHRHDPQLLALLPDVRVRGTGGRDRGRQGRDGSPARPGRSLRTRSTAAIPMPLPAPRRKSAAAICCAAALEAEP